MTYIFLDGGQIIFFYDTIAIQISLNEIDTHEIELMNETDTKKSYLILS